MRSSKTIGKGNAIKGLILGVTAALSVSTIQAASYQGEVGLMYDQTDIDPSDDITIIGVAGTYYFAPVDVDGPLAEAAFLAKASGVFVGFASVDANYSPISLDGNGYFIGVKYVIPDTGITLGILYDSLNLSTTGNDFDVSSTTIDIGMYVTDSALVSLSYQAGTISITGLPDNDTSGIGISGKWLTMMGSNAVNLETSFSQNSFDEGAGDDGSNNIFSIGGDYYFNDTLSAGVGYATNSGDDKGDEGNTISFNITTFVTDSVSILFEYDMFSADSGNDNTSMILGIAGRF